MGRTRHYSTERTTYSKKSNESVNMVEVFIQAERGFNGMPVLRAIGENSDVMVYDAITMKPLRKETPNAELIESYV